MLLKTYSTMAMLRKDIELFVLVKFASISFDLQSKSRKEQCHFCVRIQEMNNSNATNRLLSIQNYIGRK
jgi:hypothetical protein